MKTDQAISSVASVGDITKITNDSAVVDLSWLDVSEEDYRRLEALPKQNLDTIPELSGFFDNAPVNYQIEHTIVNSVPQDTPGYSSNENTSKIRNRFASFLTAGMKWIEAINRINLEFPEDEVERSNIASFKSEDGLLGNVYIDSNIFPKCHSDKQAHSIVARAKKSLYVLAKADCNGCVSNCNNRCSAFGQKILVSSVPYGPALARVYLPVLAAEHKPLRISAESIKSPSFSWKETIRKAFIQDPVKWNPDGHKTFETRLPVATVKVSDADVARVLSAKKEVRNTISTEYANISRAMMSGKDVSVHISSSKDPEVRRLASLNGIMGKYVVDIDSFGSCVKASKVSSYPNVRYIRRNASCDSCTVSGCKCGVGLSVSSSIPELGEEELRHFLSTKVERGHISSSLSGRILGAAKGKSVSGFINKLSSFYAKPEDKSYSGDSSPLHHGQTVSSKVDPETIVHTIASIINSGVKDLKSVVASVYTNEDIASLSKEDIEFIRGFSIRSAAYFDPSIYPDFGKGCTRGANTALKRRRTEKHLKLIASDTCFGCTSRTAADWCSHYAMNLSTESVEEQTRVASALLNRKTELVQIKRKASLSVPVKNEVEEYGLVTPQVVIDTESPKPDNLEFTFSGDWT